MNEVIVTFKFYRFNPVRKERGAQAAQLEVLEDGESAGLFWMNVSDIKRNIEDYGEHEALTEALEYYSGGKS
ncbi:MAG: hypothetical protein Q7T77_04675 [Sulfuricurvum sp.]|nr:hypothetical protein [Sulfuricurvum sp.]